MYCYEDLYGAENIYIRGTCFLFIAAICLVKKSNFFVFFRSFIFLTWCISTFSSLPHMAQTSNNIDLVNFAFHSLSRLFKGSRVILVVRAMFSAVLYLVLMKDTLWPGFLSIPRSFPNFLKVLDRVFNLNFFARVSAHDSLISHPIQATAI